MTASGRRPRRESRDLHRDGDARRPDLARLHRVQPPTAVAGQAITPSVVVEARTSARRPRVRLHRQRHHHARANPGNDSLFGDAMTVAAVNGIATFANLALDRAATGYSLTASSGALTSANSGTLRRGGRERQHPRRSTCNPAGGTPGVGMLPAPVVRAFDAFGNPAGFSGARHRRPRGQPRRRDARRHDDGHRRRRRSRPSPGSPSARAASATPSSRPRRRLRRHERSLHRRHRDHRLGQSGGRASGASRPTGTSTACPIRATSCRSRSAAATR
jgi:hypothetical protein